MNRYGSSGSKGTSCDGVAVTSYRVNQATWPHLLLARRRIASSDALVRPHYAMLTCSIEPMQKRNPAAANGTFTNMPLQNTVQNCVGSWDD